MKWVWPARSPRLPCPDGGDPWGWWAVHDDVDLRSLGDAGIGLLQEVRKLLGPAAPAALADDEDGSKIEGGKRRGCPDKLAVIGPLFGNARLHRRHGLRAVGRPYPGSLRRRTTSAPVRRPRMQAHHVADLVRERGTAGGLKSPERCGYNPKVVRIRRTEVCERPLPSAIGRADQWGASGVRTMTCAIRPSRPGPVR